MSKFTAIWILGNNNMASEEFSNLHFFIHVIYDGLRWRKWGIKQFFPSSFFMIVSWNDNFRKKSAFSCIENFQVIKLHKVRLLDTTHPAPSLKCDPIFFQECRNIFRGRKNLHIIIIEVPVTFNDILTRKIVCSVPFHEENE